MRIDEHVYFSPGVLLKELDIENKPEIINAFDQRVRKYYLKPIKILNKIRLAFPVGIIEFSMIDALARYSTKSNAVGDRIKEMLKVNFNTTSRIAERAYLDFRNGLIHENHIKNCGQFCYETGESFKLESDVLIVNPLKLQRDLEKYFNSYVSSLNSDDSVFNIFIDRIKNDFEGEVDYFKRIAK